MEGTDGEGMERKGGKREYDTWVLISWRYSLTSCAVEVQRWARLKHAARRISVKNLRASN